MVEAKRISKKDMLAFALLSVFPVAVILFGVVLVFGDAVINIALVLMCVIVPLTFIGVFAVVIFKSKKTVSKVVLSIVAFILMLALLLFVSIFGKFELLSRFESNEIGEEYTQAKEMFDLLPSLDEIGETQKVEHYDYFSTQCIFFDVDVDTLIACYDSQEYEKQKSILEEKYIFQTSVMEASGYKCEPETQIGEYNFRVVAPESIEFGMEYPKTVILIATNNTTKEIVYMGFYDDDIDYIESIDDFIKEDCGWKHVR